jgi:hypothetical protein
MLSAIDKNVLDAVAHSLEFDVFSISSAAGRKRMRGIGWETLKRATGLSEEALDGAAGRLLAAGLIGCGGTPYAVFTWRLGSRSATFFWLTREARRAIVERDRRFEGGKPDEGAATSPSARH